VRCNPFAVAAQLFSDRHIAGRPRPVDWCVDEPVDSGVTCSGCRPSGLRAASTTIVPTTVEPGVVFTEVPREVGVLRDSRVADRLGRLQQFRK
jgi:hypothetical protein